MECAILFQWVVQVCKVRMLAIGLGLFAIPGVTVGIFCVKCANDATHRLTLLLLILVSEHGMLRLR